MTLRPVAATLLALAGVRDGEVVVDVSCGDGLLTHPAAAAAGPAGRVYGVDPGAGATAPAPARAGSAARVAWVRAAATALPFRDGVVDKVLCGPGLADLAPALAECARVLAPGGRVVVAAWGDGALPALLDAAGLRVTHDSAAEVDGTLIRYASATAP